MDAHCISLLLLQRLTAAGDDRGAYYNELCIRSRPDLLRLLQRTRVKGTGKKAASSPQTEPDFYRMRFCPEDPLVRRNLQGGPPPTSPETTTTNHHHHTDKSINLVSPNPSPRCRTQGFSIERLSSVLFPKSVLQQSMPPSHELLPVIPQRQEQQQQRQHYLAVEEEEDYGSNEAYLDSSQFSFAWEDVGV
jgi:hypothetical protein